MKPLPDEFANALDTVYKRYTAYLDSFGPDEAFLRKKVEMELGTKMIHLKMRCSNIGSKWGKVYSSFLLGLSTVTPCIAYCPHLARLHSKSWISNLSTSNDGMLPGM